MPSAERDASHLLLQLLDRFRADEARVSRKDVGLELGPGVARLGSEEPVYVAHRIAEPAECDLELPQLLLIQLVEGYGFGDGG